ncbi:hypothetical protein PIB30_000724 [Stylosanthes scabra]|uniref:Uncharacterized protein n=1 Tax=Stylosanthes scabra TaxID=79078 RepID=A0ABU6Z3D1_9FABA|nr:hypothetical protein [Stylosanthes scabra]
MYTNVVTWFVIAAHPSPPEASHPSRLSCPPELRVRRALALSHRCPPLPVVSSSSPEGIAL